jgi:hypothetical protein
MSEDQSPSPAPAPVSAVEPPERTRAEAGRPPWLPVAAVAVLIVISLLTMLIVMLFTGELFGHKLPKGTGHGLLSNASIGGDGLTIAPPQSIDPPKQELAADPDAPLSEDDCKTMMNRVFELVANDPSATADTKKLMDDQRESMMREMLPKCQKEFKRRVYDCVMAAKKQQDLTQCDPTGGSQGQDDKKAEPATPTGAPPPPAPVPEPAPEEHHEGE